MLKPGWATPTGRCTWPRPTRVGPRSERCGCSWGSTAWARPHHRQAGPPSSGPKGDRCSWPPATPSGPRRPSSSPVGRARRGRAGGGAMREADPAAINLRRGRAGQRPGHPSGDGRHRGRLHTKVNLMEELRKVRRVAEKGSGRVSEVLLVVDATTGRTAWCRPGSSPTRGGHRCGAHQSSTAPPRAASSWPSSTSWASR